MKENLAAVAPVFEVFLSTRVGCSHGEVIIIRFQNIFSGNVYVVLRGNKTVSDLPIFLVVLFPCVTPPPAAYPTSNPTMR